MSNTDFKLYEALNTIKECCERNNVCHSCPLYGGSENTKCGLMTNGTPIHWSIKTPTEYKAFS